MEERAADFNNKKEQVMQLTSFMVHKYYCENDCEAVIKQFDDSIVWFGAGEHEYETDGQQVIQMFRSFAGKVPKCNITDEEYEVSVIAADVYLCTGRMWISTDPSVNMYLRVHQRITTIFRWQSELPKCCHIHISNPYSEMLEMDVGFPTMLGKHSYEYLQKCINEQKKKIDEQTEQLKRMSFEDSLTGLFNRNKFNQTIRECQTSDMSQLGVAYFDLNGLKRMNDLKGHSAGDDLICRTANHIQRFFNNKTYRIGGDEFVVIDKIPDEKTFRSEVASVCKNMKLDGIHISVGVSWRCTNCNIVEQIDEADKRMLEDKRLFYREKRNDRRKNKE